MTRLAPDVEAAWRKWRDHAATIAEAYEHRPSGTGAALDGVAEFTTQNAALLPHHDRDSKRLRDVARQLARDLRQERRLSDRIAKNFAAANQLLDRLLEDSEERVS